MEKQVEKYSKYFKLSYLNVSAILQRKLMNEGQFLHIWWQNLGRKQGSHWATLNVSETRGSCTCQMFERTGILCSRILNVFKVTSIFTPPTHYILKWWTRNAKSRVWPDERACCPSAMLYSEIHDLSCATMIYIISSSSLQIKVKDRSVDS